MSSALAAACATAVAEVESQMMSLCSGCVSVPLVDTWLVIEDLIALADVRAYRYKAWISVDLAMMGTGTSYLYGLQSVLEHCNVIVPPN